MRSLPLIALLALGGCTLTGEEPLFEPVDAQPPRIVASLPAHGWIAVPVGIEPRVWFSEPVDPASVGPNTVALWSGDHEAEVRYHIDVEPDGRGVVRLTPVRPLLSGVRYVLGIARRVTDVYGNPLDDFWIAAFETAP